MRTKKIFITILSCFVFAMIGSYLLIPSLRQVKASEEATDVYCEKLDISKYRNVANGHTAPKPSDTEHKDWIFAGWFYDEACTDAVGVKATTGERYAKFVPADVLSVRCQVSANTSAESPSTDMRLVSTVESNKIYRTGFKVTLIAVDGTQTTLDCKECDTVYGKIVADNGGVAYNYSPNIFDLDSTYFSTVTITGIPNASFGTAFKIEPYWITKDNTTVYGVSRYARVSDSYNGIINIPVRLYSDSEVTGGTVSVTYDSTAFVYDSCDAGDVFATVTPSNNSGTITCNASGDSATTADGMLVNLRFKAVSGKTLKSLKPRYSFAVTGSDFKNGETIVTAPNAPKLTYKNFLAEYDGTNAYTDWYNTTDSEFVLTTAPELYGLASLSASNGFAKQKIYLGADIVANTGLSTEWAQGKNTSGLYNWTPLGTGTLYFNGTFDGQGHTISGIYCKQTTLSTGFFGRTTINAKIHNLRLDNSYYENTSDAGTGSIVGRGSGEYKNLYSNAIVKSSNHYNGGMIGWSDGATTVENCWFNGSVDVTGMCSGGIVGISTNSLNINHCLNSGTINRSVSDMNMADIGGLVGKVNQEVTIHDCLNVGTATSVLLKSGLDRVGAVVGYAPTDATVKVTNTHYTTESCMDPILDGFGVNNATTKDVSGCKSISLEDLKGELASSTELDFDVYWAVVDDATPVLTTYKDMNAEKPILVDTSWYTTDVQTAKAYTITTPEELMGLAKLTTEGQGFKGWTITLGADIKLNDGLASDWAKGQNLPLNTWTTIGNSTSANFNGTFDGQGYTISGVYCSGTGNIGLFGVTAVNSAISDFHLGNSYFSNTGMQTGGVAGQLSGSVEAVRVAKDVYINTTDLRTGGIAGFVSTAGNNNRITNCEFAGTITTSGVGGYAGGILGNLFANGNTSNKNANVTIEHCLFSGQIISSEPTTDTAAILGGIVGVVSQGNSGTPTLTINDSLSVGAITSHRSVYVRVSHIVGRVYNSCSASVSATYAKALSNYSQLVTSEYTLTDFTATVLNEAKMKGTSAEKNTDLDFEQYWTTVSGNTPVLTSFAEYAVEIPVGTLIADTSWYDASSTNKTYTITTPEELMGLAQLTTEGQGFKGWAITLGADIKLNDGLASDWAKGQNLPLNTWTTIGNSTSANFNGTFDGQGYAISGVYCSGAGNIGLFGVTTVNSQIKDFHLDNSYFNNNGIHTGAVVGHLGGSVESVHVQDDVYINTTNSGAGGIAGYVSTNDSKNKVTNCEFAGTLTTNFNDGYAGGIVGQLFATVTGSGTVNSACVAVEHCLFSGQIVSSEETERHAILGGLVGVLNAGTVSDELSLNLTIDDSLSVGTITSISGDYQRVSHIVGRIYSPGSAIVTNTYAVESSNYTQLTTWGDGISDETKAKLNATVLSATQLEGLAAAENASGLDYTTYWVCTSGTPVLQSFADMSENTVLTEESVAFSYWSEKNISLADAVDAGSGSAVITIEDTTADNYTKYIDALNKIGITTKVANSEGLATQGVYNTILQSKKEDLTINVTFMKKLGTTYISIDGNESISPALTKPTTTSTSGTTSLHMMEMASFGNSFILQLKNGHFIINDGGSNYEYEYLLKYLKQLVGDNDPIIIDAWTVSHTHFDHSYIIYEFMNQKDNWGVDIRVNGFYLNLPSSSVFEKAEVNDTGLTLQTIKALKAMRRFTDENGNQTQIYRYQTGHRYYFDDITMDVVLAQEQLSMTDYLDNPIDYSTVGYKDANGNTKADGFNETSTWLMFTIEGKKVLIAGDAGPLAMSYVMSSYDSTYFDLDVFSTFHHGGNTWSTFTDFCTSDANKIDVVLVPAEGDPTSQSTWSNLEAVKTLLNDRTNKWYYWGSGVYTLNFATDGITVEEVKPDIVTDDDKIS